MMVYPMHPFIFQGKQRHTLPPAVPPLTSVLVGTVPTAAESVRKAKPRTLPALSRRVGRQPISKHDANEPRPRWPPVGGPQAHVPRKSPTHLGDISRFGTEAQLTPVLKKHHRHVRPIAKP